MWLVKLSTPIKGKITNILDAYTVILNIGQKQNVSVGMIFKIIAKVIEVKDPDSQELLGTMELEKDRVKIVQVMEKFSMAQTFESVLAPISPTLSFSQVMQRRLDTEAQEIDRTVRVGDQVIQVTD
jgi:hypothetical protein